MNVVIDVFNGEGYSSPSIFVSSNKEITKNKFAEFCRSYNADFMRIETSDTEISFEGHNDSGRVFILDIPEDKFTLIKLQPDVCHGIVLESFTSLGDAKAKLSGFVNSGIFDEDDVNDFEDELLFGSHDIKGDEGFVHYQIISTDDIVQKLAVIQWEELKIYTIKGNLSDGQIIDFLDEKGHAVNDCNWGIIQTIKDLS